MDKDEKTSDDAKMAGDGRTKVDEKRNIEKGARVVGQVRTAMQPIPSEVPYT
jgi:hypothetical protein